MGEPCTPTLCWSGDTGRQPRPGTCGAGPFITVQRRAWGEPISHLINGKGALPLALCQSTRNPGFLFRKGWRRILALKRREPPEKKGAHFLSPPRKGNQTSPAPPPKKTLITYLRKPKRTPPFKEKQGGRGFHQRG